MIRVSAGILMNDRYEVCIAKRLISKHLGGFWEFPGGKIESKESSLEALKRELLEELNVTVKHADHWEKITHVYSEKTVELDFWLVTAFEGEPISNEGQEVRWVQITDLREYEFPEANLKVVERLLLLIQ